MKIGRFWRSTVLLLVLGAATTGTNSSVSGQTRADSVSTMLNQAYDLMEANRPGAIDRFRDVVRIDPANLTARRQLGYLLAEAGRHDEALAEFAEAEVIASSDTIQLQMAYSLQAIGESERATSVLLALATESTSPDIRDAASATLYGEASVPRTTMLQWNHIYASPYYDSRWKSFFGYITVQRGLYLTANELISIYASIEASGDSKSREGDVPEIYADNAVIAAVGVRFKPFNEFTIDVQEGLAYDLVSDGEQSRFRGDFRAEAVFGTGVYPVWRQHKEARFPFTPIVDFYSSAGYYSRYDNAIGYAQVKAGVRWLEAGSSAIDAYGRLNGARDANKEFYNNILEWGGGMRVTPVMGFGVFLDLEYLHGRYYEAATGLPYGSSYDAFRIFLIFERSF